MSEQDKCPDCGASVDERDDDGYEHYECGSDRCPDGGGGYLRARSAACYERETAELRAEVEQLRIRVTVAEEAVNRQRVTFCRWRDLIEAVTMAANIQTCPAACGMIRDYDAWYDGLSDGEREAVSAALDIAATCRHSDGHPTPEDDQ